MTFQTLLLEFLLFNAIEDVALTANSPGQAFARLCRPNCMLVDTFARTEFRSAFGFFPQGGATTEQIAQPIGSS